MSKRKMFILAGTICILIIITLVYIRLQLLPDHWNRKDVTVISDNSIVQPGLGLTELHDKGFTGRVINVAIIDSLIYKEHQEFNNRLVHYEKVGLVTEIRHGTSVASVLVGKRCGVIPEANLHYFAVDFGNEDNVLKARAVITNEKGLDVFNPLLLVKLAERS